MFRPFAIVIIRNTETLVNLSFGMSTCHMYGISVAEGNIVYPKQELLY